MMKLDQNNLQIPVGWKGWWNMVETHAKRIRKMKEKEVVRREHESQGQCHEGDVFQEDAGGPEGWHVEVKNMCESNEEN